MAVAVVTAGNWRIVSGTAQELVNYLATMPYNTFHVVDFSLEQLVTPGVMLICVMGDSI